EPLVPGEAAYDVAAQLHRLLHQLVAAGITHDRLLREGDDLERDQPLEAPLELEQALDRHAAADRVDVREAAHRCRSVHDRRLDPRLDGGDPVVLQRYVERPVAAAQAHVADDLLQGSSSPFFGCWAFEMPRTTSGVRGRWQSSLLSPIASATAFAIAAPMPTI